MTNQKRLEILQNRFSECEQIFQAKGESYAGKEGDALRNFKVVAELVGITPYQVQLVYFLKHVLSITNAVKDNPNNPVDKSEGNDGRVTDVINYAVLFECLTKEVKENYSYSFVPEDALGGYKDDVEKWMIDNDIVKVQNY